MKRIIFALPIVSLFLIPGVSSAFPKEVNTSKAAIPIDVKLEMECPHIKQDPNDPNETPIVNNGITLEGPGHLKINGKDFNPPYHPVFTGIPLGKVPLNLIAGGYARKGTAYYAPGIIRCQYTSPLAGNDDINLYYLVQNGSLGTVTASTDGFIAFKLGVG